MSTRRRGVSTRVVLATAALGAALVGGLATPATAAAPSYVALGDSYSSGTGTRDYIADGTQCQRSARAYPSLVAASTGYALDFRACSGATIPDVVGNQLGALGAGTSYVTISVGGNDAGFAPVLTECAQPGWMSDCDGAIDGAEAVINGQLPGALDSLYGQIRSRAPQARVVVVGYPRIFMGEDCNAFTWFSPQEEARLNSVADQANSVLASAAGRAGFRFANPTSAFTGHAVCDDPEWLNGLSNPIGESYHPNVAGHASGYAPLVSGPLTGATARSPPRRSPPPTPRRRRPGPPGRRPRGRRPVDPSAGVRAARPHHAGGEGGRRPGRGRPSSRASIDAADRRYSADQALAADAPVRATGQAAHPAGHLDELLGPGGPRDAAAVRRVLHRRRADQDDLVGHPALRVPRRAEGAAPGRSGPSTRTRRSCHPTPPTARRPGRTAGRARRPAPRRR